MTQENLDRLYNDLIEIDSIKLIYMERNNNTRIYYIEARHKYMESLRAYTMNSKEQGEYYLNLINELIK